jgi:hypothetical protein
MRMKFAMLGTAAMAAALLTGATAASASTLSPGQVAARSAPASTPLGCVANGSAPAGFTYVTYYSNCVLCEAAALWYTGTDGTGKEYFCYWTRKTADMYYTK